MAVKDRQAERQMTIFDLLPDEYSVPVLPEKERKKGVHGWYIEYAGITNSFEDKAPILFFVGRVRRVKFERDPVPDKRWGGYETFATTDDGGAYRGWYGGKGEKLIFARKPTWGDVEKYIMKLPKYKGQEIRERKDDRPDDDD